jgi:hypothetical protein
MRHERGPDIHLYIDRLILDGLPVERNQASHVQAAVETELTRLLGENGLAANLHSGGAVPSTCANEIQLTSGSNPYQLGAQIAQSVYNGIRSI